jgi:predicted enzyme related to lactoylglutathione lyase
MTAKTYPPGVPCWVETLHPEPRAALAFYRALFGWEASEPGSMPQGGEYYVARLNGDDVAGIATLPPDGSASRSGRPTCPSTISKMPPAASSRLVAA